MICLGGSIGDEIGMSYRYGYLGGQTGLRKESPTASTKERYSTYSTGTA